MTRQLALFRAPRDSTVWRVIDFLEANPTEELTRRDVATKFGIDVVQVDDVLRPAVAANKIKRELNADSELVWLLNYSKRGIPKPFAKPLAAAKRAKSANRKSPVFIDFSALVIESGIEVVERVQPRAGLWAGLLDRMGPGDSVCLALEAKDAAAHAQYAYRKANPTARFIVRKVGDEHCRIWRLA
ncbi:MAG: hypothetical protein EPO09_19005 [Aquabacterium sp.]|uniref:hypothetical protein n=1 Tax=Aquabacterium sp. TaxID=1872578 RepID=UPI0012255C0A|nr:hypothetical protein [Aquabacterium sp.]TAK87083.1 MAG: hypothetical protein EPO09_19005 [Aquabacterium sp.]